MTPCIFKKYLPDFFTKACRYEYEHYVLQQIATQITPRLTTRFPLDHGREEYGIIIPEEVALDILRLAEKDG